MTGRPDSQQRHPALARAVPSGLADHPLTVLGVPSSAGAHGPGQELAPAALRAAGLLDRLAVSGVDVIDAGDLPLERFEARERVAGSRSLDQVVNVATRVATRIAAIRGDGDVPLVLGGDCTITLGVLAGLLQHDDAGLLYFDGDADLSVPASSGSGVLDSMGMAHLLGHGASALAGIGPRHPLLQPHQVILFGFDPGELDPAQWQLLAEHHLRAYPAPYVVRDPRGYAAEALARLEADIDCFMLHFDVDVLDSGQIPLGDFPHFAGLSLEAAMSCLEVFLASPKLAALVITEINPDHDPERLHVSRFVERLVAAVGAATKP